MLYYVYGDIMLKRNAEETVKNLNETFKVVLVTGPRQVGKTTLLKEIMPEDMTYITLDDEILREQARTNPKGFLEENSGRLFIDEVQYAPNLLSYIKINVDNSDETGQYWLTGSQQFHLMKNVSESLAGRVGILNLNSLSYNEIIENTDNELFLPESYKKSDYINVNDLYEIIFTGGMPEMITRKGLKRDAFFDSYINTYIERDIKQLTQVADELSFRKFMVCLISYRWTVDIFWYVPAKCLI